MEERRLSVSVKSGEAGENDECDQIYRKLSDAFLTEKPESKELREEQKFRLEVINSVIACVSVTKAINFVNNHICKLQGKGSICK